MKEDEMGGAYSTDIRDGKYMQNFDRKTWRNDAT
jgi:hypothetical protein